VFIFSKGAPEVMREKCNTYFSDKTQQIEKINELILKDLDHELGEMSK
jgi:magnesium-transporting ATPase (P-type)